MHICPLCNGFRSLVIACPTCGSPLDDRGKYTDYLDDYSPYMEIDDLKLFDGFPSTLKNHQCAHLFYCESCGYDEVKLIKE